MDELSNVLRVILVTIYECQTSCHHDKLKHMYETIFSNGY